MNIGRGIAQSEILENMNFEMRIEENKREELSHYRVALQDISHCLLLGAIMAILSFIIVNF